ncbi:hypothetical protein V5799_024263, partial [Amblyomma americanum]
MDRATEKSLTLSRRNIFNSKAFLFVFYFQDIRETTTPVHAFLGITTAIYLTIFVLQWLTRRIACSRGASKSETSLCAQYEETTKVQDEAMVGDNDDATSTVTGGYSASSEFVPSSSGSNQSLASTVLDVDSASGTGPDASEKPLAAGEVSSGSQPVTGDIGGCFAETTAEVPVGASETGLSKPVTGDIGGCFAAATAEVPVGASETGLSK